MTSAGTGSSRAPLAERGHDLYETPPEAVHALLKHETLPKWIWEPACGPGSIVHVLRNAGHSVMATDLVDYGWDEHRFACSRVDFLLERKALGGAETIVTNPPYKLAFEFVQHARRLCPKVIMLLRLAFLESERRSPILDTGDLACVYVFRNRLPMMHRAGWEGPKASSQTAYAWFVWDHYHRGETTIKRISWEPLRGARPATRIRRREPIMATAAMLKCGACGEVFTDPHGTGIGRLAPYECPRCGEEANLAANTALSS